MFPNKYNQNKHNTGKIEKESVKTYMLFIKCAYRVNKKESL